MMHLFYAPDILFSPVLPEEESFHAVKVLRLKEGCEIRVTDGAGSLFLAQITLANARQCQVKIVETLQQNGLNTNHLHIAIAPTKNIDRFEYFIEKAVEIGVAQITPIICKFSERKVVNAERLNKITISAAKQSLKIFFPVINPPVKFDDFIDKITENHRFIAHCYENEKTLLKDLLHSESKNIVLVGPEGDFSEDEVALAVSNGFIPVSLGDSRLRTETAGVMVCAINYLCILF